MSWYWIVFSIIIILIISLASNVVLIFRFIWKNGNNKLRQITQNIALALFSFLVVVMLVELFFVFFAQPDQFNYTLASKNWFDRYWHKNSLGYRDIEWTPELLEGRTKIMVLGDSFVAGQGIENPEDRFSNVLGRMLGNGYAVMNVGSLGASTKDSVKNAIDYPYTPDIVVLSFAYDDINDTAKDMGFKHSPFKTEVRPPFLKAWVEESYALNFLYWRMVRLGPQEWGKNLWGWLLGVYDNPDIWNVYQRELLQVHDFIKQQNGQLVVVVFPNLVAVDDSRPITSRVVHLYAAQGVPVVDVTELIEGMDYRDLIASPVDTHPNEFLNRLVAERLFQIIQNEQQTSTTP